MNNKILLESLAMDLKRVALGYQRNSLSMATRFYAEACQRTNEIDPTLLRPYIWRLLDKVRTLTNYPNEVIAEDALMLSTLLQNYAQTVSL